MSDSINLPSWAVPLVAAVIPAAIAFGSMEAKSQATDAEVAKVSQVVEKLEATTSDNEVRTGDELEVGHCACRNYRDRRNRPRSQIVFYKYTSLRVGGARDGS